MEKIIKVLSIFVISVILAVTGIFSATKILAENSYEAQQKADEQLREEQKQAAEESFENQQKATEESRELQKQDEEDQEDVNKEDNDQDEDNNDDNQFSGDDHKKTVGEAVKNLLDVADNEDEEVSDKIKEIANEQDNNKDDVAEKIDAIKNRNAMITFLIGTDFGNVGQLRSDMVKVGNQIDQLKRVLDQITNADSKAVIQTQIQKLEQEQQQIDAFIKANEDKFSLLGWLVKLFSR